MARSVVERRVKSWAKCQDSPGILADCGAMISINPEARTRSHGNEDDHRRDRGSSCSRWWPIGCEVFRSERRVQSRTFQLVGWLLQVRFDVLAGQQRQRRAKHSRYLDGEVEDCVCTQILPGIGTFPFQLSICLLDLSHYVIARSDFVENHAYANLVARVTLSQDQLRSTP
jgi:hypothetical protein